MSQSRLRKLLIVYLLLLVPIGWLAMKYQPFLLDGDAVSYMDIADLLHAHRWAGAVNGYWHPLYPAVLASAQILFHPTRWNEIPAYYFANYAIFLLELVAMVAFVYALDRLRTRTLSDSAPPLLSREALALLGSALIVIASQRELAIGLVRPDALLQALMLLAFAMLLNALATESLSYAPLMGLFFGLAYLTKSFAFVVALLSIGVMFLFQLWLQRRPLARVVTNAALALVVFGVVAGPYIAALSHQKHRFDFGDSGALNYAWYTGGVEKMHLEPWMTSSFGPATVQLIHPEQQLLASPGIYSYRAEPYGTYPDWFDTTYFNERIIPHLNLPALIKRDERNVVLVIRYLFNHPEAWILLLLLIALGARLRFGNWRRDNFSLPMILLGLAMWALYGLVNVEERYVTLAYLVVLLPVFATLRTPRPKADEFGDNAVLMAALRLHRDDRAARLPRRRREPPYRARAAPLRNPAAASLVQRGDVRRRAITADVGPASGRRSRLHGRLRLPQSELLGAARGRAHPHRGLQPQRRTLSAMGRPAQPRTGARCAPCSKCQGPRRAV